VVGSREAAVAVSDVVLTAPGGQPAPLVAPSGVAVVVLMRHRH
jgi:hypothetical protein